ncbi:amino acid ABC transporter permease [Microbacterium karelineae]|uniref:amino acid ABC transporter permease n=1 Tax=Microbacterium karelineae TaxID=2654283 RepID=UPI0012EA7F35|nr:amino acid ABC transporter permease [Microbacterium karelineae]
MTDTSAPQATRTPRRVVPVRHYGQWAGVAALALLAALLVWQVVQNSVIRWDLIFSRVGAEAIREGMMVTVVLTIVAMILGVVLGIVVAVMRISGNPVLATVAWLFVWVFRGTPLLVQVLIWFNLALFIPTIGIGDFSIPLNTISPFLAALIALTLNEAAYMSEIVRGGLLSVDRGQHEAAGALGMTPGQTLRRITLPQAMRAILPPTGNELVTLLKETSLVSVIGAGDLLYRARQIGASDFSLMEMLLVASVWYLVLTSVASVLQARLERRFSQDAPKRPGALSRLFGFRATPRTEPAPETGAIDTTKGQGA